MHSKLSPEVRKQILDRIGPRKASFIFSKLGNLNFKLEDKKLSSEEWSGELKKVIATAVKPRLIKRIFMTDEKWASQVALVEEIYGKISDEKWASQSACVKEIYGKISKL